jgi:hypothetical protein
MRIRYCFVVLLALTLTPALRAQGPGPQKMSVGGTYTYGEDNYLKGWYLYWPSEALKQPRVPMPFPYWPRESAGAQKGPSQPAGPADVTPTTPAQPPSPLYLPRDTQSLPALPGPMSWGQPYPMPFQPVSYPYYAVPTYWYGR